MKAGHHVEESLVKLFEFDSQYIPIKWYTFTKKKNLYVVFFSGCAWRHHFLYKKKGKASSYTSKYDCILKASCSKVLYTVLEVRRGRLKHLKGLVLVSDHQVGSCLSFDT